jgi:carbonic anhydrase
LLLVVQNCKAGKDWTYTLNEDHEKEAGPTKWHEVDEACAQVGTQSPIDATFKKAVIWPASFPNPNFTVAPPAECGKAHYMVTRHTTQVDFAATCPKSFEITWKGKTFKLLQFHWHSPAEHTVDGKYYAMEVHYVYISDDKQLVVVGVFMDADKTLPEKCKYAQMKDIEECHRANFFDTLLRTRIPQPPYPAGGVQTLEPSPLHNPYHEFIPPIDKYYFHYSGSLTTPGCGPVEWILVPTPVKIFDSSLTLYRNMINAVPNKRLHPKPDINKLFNDADFPWDEEHGVNNRPVQPLRGKDNPIREFYKVYVKNGGSRPHALASYAPGSMFATPEASPVYNGTTVLAGVVLAMLFVVVFFAGRATALRNAKARKVAFLDAGVALADARRDTTEGAALAEA